MFWRRKRPPVDFKEEVQAHLQLESDDLKREGVPDPESAARRAFGNVVAAEERFYEKSRFVWLDDLMHDIRYGLRTMRRSPGFTATVVLTLALGMGANTAIFSLIDAVLLRSLPVKDPASLYFLDNIGAKGPNGSPPYPCFERFRALATSFTGMAAYTTNDVSIRIDSTIESVNSAGVSGNYYTVLGVTPFAGRLLTESDESLDPPVAVISYDFWQRRFAGSPDAIGRTYSLDGALDGRRFTIVGITPKDFHGLKPGQRDDITVPFTIAGERTLKSNSSWFFSAIARLKPGVSPQRAQAEIDPIFQAFMNEHPQSAANRRDAFHNMVLNPASRGMDQLRKRYSRPLWVLMAVVGLVLLIGCANITNLLLARAAKREREFAVRVAIGAGRLRLFRQVLVETGLLFAMGAVAGIAVAWWASRGIAAFFAGGAHAIHLDVQQDWTVIAFTAGLSLLTTLIFGAAPILHALRADPHTSMKDGGRTTQSRRRVELGQYLVAFQVALSLILLAGSALFLRTLGNLYSMGANFHADQVGLMLIHLPDASYHTQPSRLVLWDRLLAEVRSLPGVRSASLSRMTPLDGSIRGVGFEVPGFQIRSDSDHAIRLNTVSEDYFSTMGTSLLTGRDFTSADRTDGQTVVIINETARKYYFAGRDPVGTVVGVMGKLQYRIVGVVQDARQADLRDAPIPYIYVPLRQPVDMGAFMTLSVRIAGTDPAATIAGIAHRMPSVGSDIHIVRTDTLRRQLDESILQERLITTLATAFAALALLLSAVGLYGILSHSVARRTAEIGIRMTLGAMPGEVAWRIVRQTLLLVSMGLAVGVAGSIFLARLAEKLLYGVTPTDFVALAGSCALLAVVACVASYLPARRAGRIDPMSALRSE